MEIEVYHTQKFRPLMLKFPVLAEGPEQWLGDGYYFWQDYDFSIWWGENKKKNEYKQFSIFKAKLIFDENQFIDTVFNEEDYYNFVRKVEKFAKRYESKYKNKPTLEEFNDFVSDFNLWTEISVIRFQDVPLNDNHVMVKSYYYKKRIQLRVNKPEIITNFAHVKNHYHV